jgi:DNA-binding IclR family transcriptional regulator
MTSIPEITEPTGTPRPSRPSRPILPKRPARVTRAIEPYEVPALRRADLILQRLSEVRAPVRPAELIEATGLARSTLYLLLESLERRRWIERRDDGYVIGVRLFEHGSGYLRHDGLQEAFRTAAGAFVARHNEAVQMAVLDGAEVVYVAREDANRPVRLVSDPGMRLPAHCSALGKAMLASLDDADVVALLPQSLAALTERSITRLPQLLKTLAQVRATGVALDVEEASAGLHCLAAYVGLTAMGRRVAVSTSVPVERMNGRREKLLANGIAQLARQIGVRVSRRAG